MKRVKPQGRVTEMTVGQLKDYADPAQLANVLSSSADETVAIHYPNTGPPGGTIVADGPTSFSFYTSSARKLWPDDDVLGRLTDDFCFHLERRLGVGKDSQ